MAVSSTHNGWRFDRANSRLDFYYRGTRVGHIDANSFDSVLPLAVTGAITATTTIAATTTVTAGTGLTVTAGNGTITAGDLRVTAGNARLGAVAAFASTEPTSTLVMKEGTAPAGAIVTSGGIFSSATVVRKIIADGTVSNVET